MVNKKGEFSIAAIVTTSIGIVLLAYLFIPQVQQSTQSQSATAQSIAYITAPTSANFTLTSVPIDASTISLSGLVENTNFTVLSATTGLININATNNITSTANYRYYTNNKDNKMRLFSM